LINLHIIGIQKAGTTALAHFLNQHPAIYVVDGKEAHVFDHPDYKLSHNKAQFIKNKYLQKLKNLAHQRIICDATPITIYKPQFLQACIDYNKNAKFIVVLRDPVSRAVSHYRMSKHRGEETRSMLLAFLLEPLRLLKCNSADNWPFSSPMRTKSYLSRGLYSRQLTNLYQRVERDRVLVVTQEDLKSNHQSTLNRIYLFLDIQKHNVLQQTVFETKKFTLSWRDKLAIHYAKFYFKLNGENLKKWHSIIQDPPNFES
jgi:hypothetical protein